MNTLLHFADAALQYHRGRHTGFWGLVGIALAVLTASSWDVVQPAFEFVGIVSLLDKIGLIAEGAPELTFFRLFMATFGVSIAFMVIGSILIFLFTGAVSASQSKIGKAFVYVGIAILLSPVLLFYVLLRLIDYSRDKIKKKQDPLAYAERERLAKNSTEINILQVDGCSERESNELTHEEAYNRLNRLPTLGDHLFLVGVTYEREFFVLLPRPFGVLILGTNDEILTEKISIKKYDPHNDKPTGFSTRDPKSLVAKIERENWEPEYTGIGFTRKKLHEFERIFNCSRSDDLLHTFHYYTIQKPFKEYVNTVQNHYFEIKEELVNQLSAENTKEEFDETVSKLRKYDAPNEEVVKYIWEGNRDQEIS